MSSKKRAARSRQIPPGEIVRATPGARRKVVIFWIAVLLFGIFVVASREQVVSFVYNGILDVPHSSRTEVLKRLQRLTLWIFAAHMALDAVLSYLLFRVALKILRTDQFPAPGTKVFKDTRVVRGRRARFMGWVYVVAGVLLLTLPAFLYWSLIIALGRAAG